MKIKPNQVALSVQQPWAHFIVQGIKPIENRTWPCPEKHIGTRVYIHTGKKFDDDGLKWLKQHAQELGIVDELDKMSDKKDYPMGGIVGEATLEASVTAYAGAWFAGLHGFVLAGAKAFRKLMPCKGQLGFFQPKVTD